MGDRADAFHPKLWLVRGEGHLNVLSGSGNLTGDGLVHNDEQFEMYRLAAGTEVADGHEQRFADLTAHAIPLQEARGTAAWLTWRNQLQRRREISDELRRLDLELAADVAISREADKRRLCDDLFDLYEQTVAAKLRRRDGQRYVPTRFKQSIDRACHARNPVPTVTNICRHQTEGFDVILKENRPDLTVESLVVDKASLTTTSSPLRLVRRPSSGCGSFQRELAAPQHHRGGCGLCRPDRGAGDRQPPMGRPHDRQAGSLLRDPLQAAARGPARAAPLEALVGVRAGLPRRALRPRAGLHPGAGSAGRRHRGGTGAARPAQECRPAAHARALAGAGRSAGSAGAACGGCSGAWRCSATPATTSPTPPTSTPVGTWANTTTPITMAMAGSSETSSA